MQTEIEVLNFANIQEELDELERDEQDIILSIAKAKTELQKGILQRFTFPLIRVSGHIC